MMKLRNVKTMDELLADMNLRADAINHPSEKFYNDTLEDLKTFSKAQYEIHWATRQHPTFSVCVMETDKLLDFKVIMNSYVPTVVASTTCSDVIATLIELDYKNYAMWDTYKALHLWRSYLEKILDFIASKLLACASHFEFFSTNIGVGLVKDKDYKNCPNVQWLASVYVNYKFLTGFASRETLLNH